MNTPADVAAETATYPRDSKNDGKPGSTSDSSERVRPLWRESDGNYDFRATFSKVRRKFTISGPLWQKLSRNWKSRTETGNSSRKFSKSDRILDFRPAFAKVVRNLKK